jgi:hypothetical protein
MDEALAPVLRESLIHEYPHADRTSLDVIMDCTPQPLIIFYFRWDAPIHSHQPRSLRRNHINPSSRKVRGLTDGDAYRHIADQWHVVLCSISVVLVSAIAGNGMTASLTSSRPFGLSIRPVSRDECPRHDLARQLSRLQTRSNNERLLSRIFSARPYRTVPGFS